MSKLKKLFENYLKSSYRTTPVRSPFSHASYYSGGYTTGEHGWKELTDLYNTTYRTHYEDSDGGFERVMYNEPLNVMVWWTKDDAEAFEHVEEKCVVTLGIKAARGFRKDYRFLDMSIPGAGKVAVDEQTADQIITDPYETLRNVRPEFMRNFGEVPVEQPKTQEEVNEMLQESAGEARKVNRIIREELDSFLSEYRDQEIGLSEKESTEARRKLRKRQIDEDITQIEDALIDVCARQLREGEKISKAERIVLENTLQQ